VCAAAQGLGLGARQRIGHQVGKVFHQGGQREQMIAWFLNLENIRGSDRETGRPGLPLSTPATVTWCW
jgi:hypothetical protein